MLDSSGFEVVDLGVDVAPDTFVHAIKKHQPDIVGLSALLTTTLPMIRATVDAIKTSGIASDLKIIIGGAPVTQAFADEAGDDGYTPDAGSASRLAKSTSIEYDHMKKRLSTLSHRKIANINLNLV